jgi:peptidoglycan/xylan/chitin deacetylase (PgdA/CDA1 family)
MSASPEGTVPKPRRAAYYLSKQWAHRLQAARARAAAQDGWTSGLRIFSYHRISTDRDELAVTPRAFRAQMEALLGSGAKPVHLDDALDLLEADPTGRYVSVTFDDGYHDNLEHAIPVLRELDIPATIFVASAVIDGTARLYWYDTQPPVLSWSELAEISRDALFTIGAHTRTHPALPQLIEDAAWTEIAESKRDVEEHIEKPATSFAYPAGMYGEREVEMVGKAGYRTAVTTVPGLNTPDTGPHLLRRMLIDRRDNLAMFEAKLTGLLDDPWGFADALALRRRLWQRSRQAASTSR